MTFVLDTHVWLRMALTPERLSKKQQRIISKATTDAPLFVSAISLVEIAGLHATGRVKLGLPLREWLTRATEDSLVRVADLSIAIVCEVAAFGERMHRDPADRLIVATALIYGAKLLSSDAAIEEAGIVDVIA